MPKTLTPPAPGRRRIATPLRLAALLVAAPWLVGCSSPTPPPAPPPLAAASPTPADVPQSPPDPVSCSLATPPVLGAVLPLSGPNAARGEEMARGLRLATDQVERFAFIGPDTVLELRIEDGGGGPSASGEAVAALIADGVSAIVGPIDGRDLLAAIPRAAAAGVPVLVPGASPTGGLGREDGVFRVAPDEQEIARAAVGAVKAEAESAIVLGFGDGPQARAAAEAMATAAEEAGLRLEDELWANDRQDLDTALLDLADGPRKILLLADSPDDHAVLLESLRQGAPSEAILVGGDAFNTARPAPGGAEGVVTADLWHAAGDNQENDYLLEDWRAAYDDEPGSDAVRAYTAVVLAATAIRLSCSGEPADVRAGLEVIELAPTPLGSWSFGATGGPTHAPEPLVWRAGRRLPYRPPAAPAP